MNENLFLKGDFSTPLSGLDHLKNQLLNLDKFKTFHQDDSDLDVVGISSGSKKIYKKRTKYNKINNEIRLKLIDAVEKDGELLKSAAKRFNVNYSSAKSIFQTYRKEGRVLRKTNKNRQPCSGSKSVDKENEEEEIDELQKYKATLPRENQVFITSVSSSTNLGSAENFGRKNEIFGFDLLGNFAAANNLLKMNEEKLKNSLLLRSILGGFEEAKPMTNNTFLNTQYIFQNNNARIPNFVHSRPNDVEEFQYAQNLDAIKGLMQKLVLANHANLA